MPRTTSATPVVRLVVVIALAALCLSSAWFQIKAKGTFTEGLEREPTLWANYTIDGQVEVIELEISNSTPLIVYWSEREIISSSNGSNSSSSEGGEGTPSASSNGDGKQDESSQEDGFLNLARARDIVKALVLLCCFLELLCVIKPMKITRGLAVGVWMAGFFALTILVPVSLIVGSFGGGGQEDDEAQPGDGFDTGEESDSEQFAHSTFESAITVHLNAIVWSFDSSGYDLGLVEEQDRDSVRQSPPGEGEPGADSLIRFSGDIRIVTSDGVWIWFSIPVFWILITLVEKTTRRLLETFDGNESGENDDDEQEPEGEESTDSVSLEQSG